MHTSYKMVKFGVKNDSNTSRKSFQTEAYKFGSLEHVIMMTSRTKGFEYDVTLLKRICLDYHRI